MTMNIRQEKTIKATEVSSTMQCKAGSDIRKGEVVGIARSLTDSESAEGMVFQVIVCAMV